MLQLLNTLYVMTQRAYLQLDHDSLRVQVEHKTELQVPLLHLGAITCFGDVGLSPALMHRCAEDGRSIVLLDRNGRFKARIEGPTSGNVLLRRAQHLALDEAETPTSLAREFVAGKLQNSRRLLMRSARDSGDTFDASALRQTSQYLADSLAELRECDDLDTIRGQEGHAAHRYFQVFERMVRREQRDTFAMDGRNRRPPRDPMNALLSFLYALLLNDCRAALEGVGLDPQIGFLHALRPGRASLALDLMEEFRPLLADRLALTLVNRNQLTKNDFESHSGGAVLLNDQGRRAVVVAYQKRKQEEVQHRVLARKAPLGLVPHLQARLLARRLRGDLEHYIPFIQRS